MNTLGIEPRQTQAIIPDYFQMLTECPDMGMITQLIERMAMRDDPVIIAGNTGVGKELAARSLHSQSNRAGSFISINCGNQNFQLIGSELFGHERGAFTGAITAHIGAFERAKGGTLFLDEIGTLPLELQPRFLKALDGEFNRVGSTQTITSNFRLISATNSNLRMMVEKGEFREDLYYRLNVLRLEIPPLHLRKNDIAFLAQKFSEESCPGIALDRTALTFLQEHGWPGNIRELRNVMMRAVFHSDGTTIRKEDIQLDPASAPEMPETTSLIEPFIRQLVEIAKNQSFKTAVDYAKKQLLKQLLIECAGNLSLIERRTNMTARSLGFLVKKFGLKEKRTYSCS